MTEPRKFRPTSENRTTPDGPGLPAASETAVWNLGQRTLSVTGDGPLVMGILNVTPDSFSDGGRFEASETAVEAALQMEADGADIIDIGGESTRPYSDSVAVSEEVRRVMPVIERLAGRLSVPISIDTSKAEVARQAVAGGAEIINDVTGLAGDPGMLLVASQCRAGLCVMHMQGTPQTMQDDPDYDDVVAEIYDYLVARRDELIAAGIRRDRICLDPGIGFGKSHQHNLTLLRNTHRFCGLGVPLLIGHSRKGFIAHVLGDKENDRTAGTVGVTLAAAAAGAHVVRVHDVKANVDALRLFAAVGGIARR